MPNVIICSSSVHECLAGGVDGAGVLWRCCVECEARTSLLYTALKYAVYICIYDGCTQVPLCRSLCVMTFYDVIKSKHGGNAETVSDVCVCVCVVDAMVYACEVLK